MIHEPRLHPILLGGKRAGYVAVGESLDQALRRMWARLCVGEPDLVLPCGCAEWNTRYGIHTQRGSACGLNGYEHEDILKWLGAF